MPFKWFGKVSFVPYTRVTEFADELRERRLVGSKCLACGQVSFPPRADCIKCLSPAFEWEEYSGECTLNSFTVIHAAPTGFDDMAPYIVGIVDLPEGGRLLAWLGDITEEEIEIGMPLKVVPRIFEEIPEIKVYYTLEKRD